jgi:cytidylate kinase
MKNRLILIEGIPGSGKSTMAGKLKAYLDSKDIPAKVYIEGDLHPADLSWCAYLTLDEYHEILDSYPEHKDSIIRHTLLEGEHAILACRAIFSSCWLFMLRIRLTSQTIC